MRNLILFIILTINVFISGAFAQDPESFFPHNVGDTWQYVDNEGRLTHKTIIKDSVGLDGSHTLSYNLGYPQYRIDTSFNVFESPNDPFWNYLLYKLDADTGEVWEGINDGISWVWVSRVESAHVFSVPTVVKVYRYGPGRPDSAGSEGLLEAWLASNFGLIYSESDASFIYLQGCVIAGDTFGYITSVNNIQTEMPSEFQLKQNYPNPFNPTTTIEFELSNEAETNIYIYDILGRQVSVLFEGRLNTGNHKMKWDAKKFASGIYFCRVQANDKIRTIKMLLTK